jgi:hypothetical protein
MEKTRGADTGRIEKAQGRYNDKRSLCKAMIYPALKSDDLELEAGDLGALRQDRSLHRTKDA